ncbi:nucleoside deaminase [Pseudotabrizicola algicola]|uniref:Nucleoside deaminase n=1 Tax=Pseudotabrizicola algicola TaxID=2709381 RepID=A0A6B3RTR5_9RHOB|nr:nucleoside deaminase [Pseudotabrizicola algicola]NEX46472.1 nucleoside deaminase [Pseudotabrizicola algicola]
MDHGNAPTPAENRAMNDAIERALSARHQSGKAGIAASILCEGQSIATAENEVQLHSDPTQHAEMVAITRAAAALGTTDLSGCVMISTLQPCEMCLAAMRFAGITRVIFAATQERVAGKYFVFPHLNLRDFQKGGDFVAIGGVGEDRVLYLYATGKE